MTTSEIQENHVNPGKKKVWIVIVLIGIVAVLFGIGVRLFQDGGDRVQLGQIPEDFVLDTYSGEIIDTANLLGKVILINFWASWCDPCEEEALLLEEAWQELGQASSDVIFLGVAYNDTEPASQAFLEEYGITYPNGPDLRGEISAIYNVNGVPETYILDQSGRLQYVKYGPFLTADEIRSVVEQILYNLTEE
jgi:cytochrome c biogenesis protein CcmG/thiol:disulfide interchange protein DsbE